MLAPMAAPKLDLVLLTDDRWDGPVADTAISRQLLREDALLLLACRDAGLRAERVAWSDPGFDWGSTRAAIFRSTWDYSHRAGEFAAWLGRASAATRLINDVATVRWNMDKRYLLEFAQFGVPIVPTQLVERGGRLDLGAHVAEWSDVIVKPAISGAARETWRIDAANLAERTPQIERLLAAESLLVQPFRHEIVVAGELSIVVIDGRVSHAVQKRPKPGDFRVQDDHGGHVVPHKPTAKQLDFALRAVAAAPGEPLYARVDFIETLSGLELMELELIEPELFFRFRPEAAKDLAAVLARALGAPAKS